MRIALFFLSFSLSPTHGQNMFLSLQTIDYDLEALHASDIGVIALSFSCQQERGDWTFELGFTGSDYEIDYAPVASLGGAASELSERTWSGNLGLSKKVSDNWKFSVAARAYDGFVDYRSIWIAEYYRQTFDFPGSGYVAPDPKGWALTTGVVWSPSLTRQVALDFTYGHDIVAPGWTFQQASNDRLLIQSVALRWQEALNPRLKSEAAVLFTDVMDRQHRVIVQSAWNYAVTDELTARLHFGGGKENPSFSSGYAGIALSYDLNASLSVGAVARVYNDAGEIENSGFNTAAPGLTSSECGVNMRYTREEHTFSFSASYFDSNYDPVDVDNDFFANLYRDREWGVFRFAYTREF